VGAEVTRLALDVLWGVPSIVYGAFGFIIMLWLGVRASLLGGIIALAFPGAADHGARHGRGHAMVPRALKEAVLRPGSDAFGDGAAWSSNKRRRRC
jgi:phosphate transport system permease protein